MSDKCHSNVEIVGKWAAIRLHIKAVQLGSLVDATLAYSAARKQKHEMKLYFINHSYEQSNAFTQLDRKVG